MAGQYSDTPLGKKSEYVDSYMPSLLCPVPRWDGREELEIEDRPPFHGMDFWYASELSWLDQKGKPHVAVAEFMVPCTTRNLIESKSVKLYLNSFGGTRFESPRAVKQTIENDTSACVEGAVDVVLRTLGEAASQELWTPSGTCLDHIDLTIETYERDPELLLVDQGAERTEQLFSHLFRSRCPVTGQPDWATMLIRYTGQPISMAGLLRYLVSYRNDSAFHEHVVEQIFMDIKNQCQPRQLSVEGLFTRRGGISISPFRSDFESQSSSPRVIRQ